MRELTEAIEGSRRILERHVDPWAIALRKLQVLKCGQWLRIRDVAKNNPDFFKQVVKQLIRAGWSEYEFNDEYTEIRRLDLPDYARGYFREQRTGLEADKAG